MTIEIIRRPFFEFHAVAGGYIYKSHADGVGTVHVAKVGEEDELRVAFEASLKAANKEARGIYE